MAATRELEPALTPGAFAEHLRRELPDGSRIEFEFAPAGWLGRGGKPRSRDWRAYFITPPGGGRRRRLPSVTSVLGAIIPKGGLVPWAEARGIEGAVRMIREGRMNVDHPDPVAVVRGAREGADAARDEAADRGLDVHACLEQFMRDGTPPNPADFPEGHRGFLRGLTRWLLARDPEPVAVEQLVASREHGYAGRMDLRAMIGGRLVSVDLKTQARGLIYSSAHVQLGMYELAARECGDPPADGMLVVSLAADGTWREMPADHPPELVEAALAWHQALRPIEAACAAQARAGRQAREAVAA